MSRALSGYIIVAGILASPLRGQDVAQMQRRVDSTFRASILAQQAVFDYRRAHPVRFDFNDSAVVAGGRVTVYFDASVAKQVRAGVAIAEPHLVEVIGALSRITPFVFSVVPDSQYNPSTRSYSQGAGLSVRQHFGSEPKPARTSVAGDPESIAYVFLRSVANGLTAKSPSHIGQWMSGTVPLAPDLDTKTDWASVRLTMVSSPSNLGRSCFEGSIPACRVFLGLDSTLENASQGAQLAEYSRESSRAIDSIAIFTYFDALGRRRRVLYDIDRARISSKVATDRCLGGNDEACIAVLYRMGGGVSVLSSPFIRGSVVTQAIRLGGPGSVQRLLTTEGTYAQALSATARLPVDSLIANWQSHLGERSATGNVPFTIAISSIIWIGICVFLALRSSRWR